MTGIPLAIVSLDLHVSDTYFIIGHFHYVMAVAGTFSIFGGVYYLYPKFTGKMYNETIAKIGFWLSFIGVNTIFFPMMIFGVTTGIPRRYWNYSFKGTPAGDNPWGSRSLEWTTTSPPLAHGNWEAVPTIAEGWGPYEYGTDKA